MAKQVKFTKALAAHIDKLRRERKLSFQQMADDCNMDKIQVFRICTDGVDIKASTIVKIAKGLDVQPGDILNFKY